MNNPLIAFEDKSINPLPLKGNLQMSNMIDINKALISEPSKFLRNPNLTNSFFNEYSHSF